MSALLEPWLSIEPPRKVIRKLNEGKIQSTCVAFARGRGFWARKFSSPSQRSVPDYLFSKMYVLGVPVKFAVEFKSPGKKPSDNQFKEQAVMGDAGWWVWQDCGRNGQADIERFKALIVNLDRYSGDMDLHALWSVI